MTTVAKSIDVDVPVRTAYDQWTQFEDFPRFMEGVERVRQRDDVRLDWVAEIGGVRREWQAQVVEQVPDERVAWVSTHGARHAGTVTFRPVEAGCTRVTLQLQYEPEGVVEKVGDWIGVVDRRVEGDLTRFKSFIEARGRETGAWRGEVHEGRAEPAAAAVAPVSDEGLDEPGSEQPAVTREDDLQPPPDRRRGR